MSGAPQGFAGDLGAFGLADLIQTIAMGGRTGRLTARSGGKRGELWFREGRLIHAEAGSLSGDPSVYEMLGWNEGAFAVDYGLETDKRSIEQEATYLVLEGVRRLDEKGGAQRESAHAEETAQTVQDAPAEPNRLARKRRRRRSAAGTIVILALAVTAVVWIAAARGSASLRVPPAPSESPVLESGMDAAGLIVSPAREWGERADAEPASDTPSPETPAELRPEPAEEPPAKTLPRPEVPIPSESPEWIEATIEAPLDSVSDLESDPLPDPPTTLTAFLDLEGKSYVEEGAIRVFVDGQVVYTRALERQRRGFARAMRRMVAAGDERFEERIPVPAGTREIFVEVDLGDEAGVYHETSVVEFEDGASRTLRVTAGKAVGQPVRVKLD